MRRGHPGDGAACARSCSRAPGPAEAARSLGPSRGRLGSASVASRDPLVERMRGFGTTIFAEMSALAVHDRQRQPRPGLPRHRRPGECWTRPPTAIRAGHNQYPPGPGIPELRHAIAAHQRRYYGLDLDPDTEVLVTAGATEAIAAAVLAACRPGRRGRHLRAVLRLLRRDASRSAARTGARSRSNAPAPTGRSTPTRCARAVTPAHAGCIAAQLAAQPDRQGLHPRRAGARSPTLAIEHDLSSSPTRCTSTSSSTAEPRPDRDAAGHARAHDHDRQRGQDVHVHRLEDRLGLRAGRAASRRCAPSSSSSPTSTAARSSPRSPSACATPTRYLAGLRRDAAASSATCSATGSRDLGLRRRRARRRPTSPPSTSASATRSAFCRELPRTCGVVAIPSIVFYDSARRRHARALRVLQAAGGARRGAGPAREEAGDSSEGRRRSSTTSCGRTPRRPVAASRR